MKKYHFVLILLCCALCFGFAQGLLSAPSFEDEENALIAIFLARRYQLYDEAKDFAESQIKDAEFQELTLARVFKTQAEAESNESERKKLLQKAHEILKKSDSPQTKLESYTLSLDLLDFNNIRKEDQETIEDTIASLLEFQNKLRNYAFEQGFDWAVKEPQKYESFIKSFYQLGRALYARSLLSTQGSKERQEYLSRLSTVMLDMQFEITNDLPVPSVLFDAYILEGDAIRKNGEPESAVEKYLELPSYLSGDPKSNYTVEYQSLRGYLKAIETLVTDLSLSEEANRQALEIIERAQREFPAALGSAQGKELRLYQISADLNLGGKVEESLQKLFKLVDDPSSYFRIKAGHQISKIAQTLDLSLEQRLQCARKVLATESYELVLVAMQIYQGILLNLHSEQTFEAYAPTCYLSIGLTYESLNRYVDAANIFQEGAMRLAYLREKYGSEGSEERLPAHFFDADQKAYCLKAGVDIKLENKGDAYAFPKDLAQRALTNAQFLLSTRLGGDSSNQDFKDFYQEMQEWFQPWAGLEKRYQVLKSEGYKAYNEKAYERAAQYLLSTLPSDSGVIMANYFAGAALARAYADKGLPEGFNLSPEELFLEGYDLELDDIVEGGVDFDGLEVRLRGESQELFQNDFPSLPENLLQELKQHSQKLHGDQKLKDEREYLWEMAQYAFKRCFLFALEDDYQKLRDRGVELEKLRLWEALAAHAEIVNQDLLGLPAEERKEDPTMVNLGKAAYQLAMVLRRPQVSILNQERRTEREDQLRDERSEEALAWLEMAWDAYGPHFEILTKSANKAEKAQAQEIKLNLVWSRFNVFIEQERVKEAFAEFQRYEKVLEDLPQAQSLSLRSNLIWMIRNLHNTYATVQMPKIYALIAGAENLETQGVRLSNGTIRRIALAKVKEEAGEEEQAKVQQRVGTFIREYLTQRMYGVEAKYGSHEIGKVMPEALRQEFEVFWNNSLEGYQKSQRLGIQKVIEVVLQEEGMKEEVRVFLGQFLASLNAQSIESSIEKLYEGSNGLIEAGKSVEGGQLFNAAKRIENITNELAWGQGDAFLFELRSLMEEHASLLRDEAQAAVTTFLHIAERNAELSNKGLYSTAQEAAVYAKLYGLFDEQAKNAYQAWSFYFEQKKKDFSDESYIPVDSRRQKIVNDENNADEIEARYQLGQLALRILKQQGTSLSEDEREEYFEQALHHLRRCLNFVNWRNGAEFFAQKGQREWKKNLQESETGKAIDLYFVPIIDSYTELCFYCVDNGVQLEWKKKYYQQDGEGLEKRDGVFVQLPENMVAFLKEASFYQSQVWRGTFELPGGFYNTNFRDGVQAWVKVRELYAEVLAKEGPSDEAQEEINTSMAWIIRSMNEILKKDGFVFDQRSKAFLDWADRAQKEALSGLSSEYRDEHFSGVEESEAEEK